MVANGFRSQGLKSSSSYVQGHRLGIGANLAPTVHQFWGPVQARGRSSHRALMPRKNRLVSVAVLVGVGAAHVGWEGNPPYLGEDFSPSLRSGPAKLQQRNAVFGFKSLSPQSALVLENLAVLPFFLRTNLAPCPQ